MASGWSTARHRVRREGRRALTRAYFNRGFVISQFVSAATPRRALPRAHAHEGARAVQARHNGDDLEDRVRLFLSGHLRAAMIRPARGGPGRGRGGLRRPLRARRQGAGSRRSRPSARAPTSCGRQRLEGVKTKKEPATGTAVETSAQARKRDENVRPRAPAWSRATPTWRRGTGSSRPVRSHTTVLVVTDAAGKATRLWTGSTNWTTTGLCTQLNNGLFVLDPAIAGVYLQQWQALRDAAPLTRARSRSRTGRQRQPAATRRAGPRARCDSRVRRDASDLAELGGIVRAARRGSCPMFTPGDSGVLADVRALAAGEAGAGRAWRGHRAAEGPTGGADREPRRRCEVTTVGTASPNLDGTRSYDVVQPEGKAHPAACWAAETTRRQFLGSIGHAIIHSKVIVVDPFSDRPHRRHRQPQLLDLRQREERRELHRRARRRQLAKVCRQQQAPGATTRRGSGNPHPSLNGIEYLRALLDDQRAEEPFWGLDSTVTLTGDRSGLLPSPPKQERLLAARKRAVPEEVRVLGVRDHMETIWGWPLSRSAGSAGGAAQEPRSGFRRSVAALGRTRCGARIRLLGAGSDGRAAPWLDGGGDRLSVCATAGRASASIARLCPGSAQQRGGCRRWPRELEAGRNAWRASRVAPESPGDAF